ncbi:hypothetical protein [Variovorax sp. IB41]|uniref:hypothetical protein n=1 Tax=Variovorax sp. IB41 TaxID=2779370 RepID=UPI0018E87715|nr:hypothetical protein [Variovorax sp. IB41]MBJ2155288.1 hypothetical protein [Variovorax sp. IB41]
MTSFLYIVTLFSSVAGAFTLASAFSGGSAPQQAALAAVAIGLAVIPYVFSRCVQISVTEARQKKEHAQMIDRLDALERATSKMAETRSGKLPDAL